MITRPGQLHGKPKHASGILKSPGREGGKGEWDSTVKTGSSENKDGLSGCTEAD